MDRIKKFRGLAEKLIGTWYKKVKVIPKKKLMFAAIPIILLIAFAGWGIWNHRAVQASKTTSLQRTATVVKGTMEITLSGSGAISADARSELAVEANGKVIENFMEEGKAVKAGDVLLTLNSTEAELSLEQMENTVLQKEQTYLKEQNQVSSLNLKAPFSGKVTGISNKVGDNVNNGAALLTVADESSLIAKVQFQNASAESLKGAQSIQLHIPEYTSTLTAKLENIKQVGDDVDATLSIRNPGALKAGINAWAEVNTSDGIYTSNQVPLEWTRQEIFKAESSGTVEKLNVSENQKVSAGELLMAISNNDLPLELENARLQLEAAKNSFEQARLNLDKYKIVAPFDGNIVSVANLKPGDSIKAGTVAAVLIDTNKFSFKINIDELDINKVKKGQNVSITAEALEDTATTPLKGVVTSVALEGTSNNGVTSYPVTVSIEGRDGLRSGMNVDGVIEIEKKENVLMVPLEAVQKRGSNYTVWVKREGAAGTSADNGTAANDSFNTRQPNQAPSAQQQQFANMTEEQRQAFRQRMSEQRSSQSGRTQGTNSTQNTNQAQGSSSTQNSSSTTTQYTRSQGTANTRNSAGSNPYYAGAVQVRVKVGIHNETYLEILEGLNEGDVVVLPQVTASAQSSQNQGSSLNSSFRGISGAAIPSMGGGYTPRSGGQR